MSSTEISEVSKSWLAYNSAADKSEVKCNVQSCRFLSLVTVIAVKSRRPILQILINHRKSLSSKISVSMTSPLHS